MHQMTSEDHEPWLFSIGEARGGGSTAVLVNIDYLESLIRVAGRTVLQTWVTSLPMMQQTVLMTAVRGPDGLPKYHPVKFLLRWYRRSSLLAAIDKKVLQTPWEDGGGSFTGRSVDPVGRMGLDVRATTDEFLAAQVSVQGWAMMDELVDEYLQSLDGVPHHFQLHFMHGAEILGYKHPVLETRSFWIKTYRRLVNDMHLRPELEEVLDMRLSDSRENWLKHSDPATTA